MGSGDIVAVMMQSELPPPKWKSDSSRLVAGPWQRGQGCSAPWTAPGSACGYLLKKGVFINTPRS